MWITVPIRTLFGFRVGFRYSESHYFGKRVLNSNGNGSVGISAPSSHAPHPAFTPRNEPPLFISPNKKAPPLVALDLSCPRPAQSLYPKNKGRRERSETSAKMVSQVACLRLRAEVLHWDVIRLLVLWPSLDWLQQLQDCREAACSCGSIQDRDRPRPESS